MSFPNSPWHPTCDGLKCDRKGHAPGEHPRWRPVEGKPGIWRHDENDPCCEAALHAFECPECGERKWGQHRVSSCDHGDALTPKQITALAICRCGETMTALDLSAVI